jgi:hypothetical protein
VFSRHWKNMTRAFVREVDSEIVALVRKRPAIPPLTVQPNR